MIAVSASSRNKVQFQRLAEILSVLGFLGGGVWQTCGGGAADAPGTPGSEGSWRSLATATTGDAAVTGNF